MKKLLFILLLSPLIQMAQPRFEKDTLYTSGGYKIYNGRVLQLANGSSSAGYFRFIKFHTNMNRTDTYILQNSTILVNKLRNFKNSGTYNYSIRIAGTANYKDGSKAEVDIIMDFERAIQSPDGLPNELIVPEEFKKAQPQMVTIETKKQTVPDKQPVPDELKKLLVADEIKKLFDLYKAGALTKEEYDAQKKKLLDKQ